MQISKLQKNDVIIQDLQETEITTSDEKELTPEEKEKVNKLIHSSFCRRWKHIFQLMNQRMKKYNLSVDDLKTEIQNKKSPFTKSQREFILSWKTDYLDQCLKDLFKGPRKL